MRSRAILLNGLELAPEQDGRGVAVAESAARQLHHLAALDQSVDVRHHGR